MRRRTLLVAVAASLSLVASARATTAGTVPGDAAFPESIAAAPTGSTVYVSSFATGAVVKGTLGGALQPFLAAGADGRISDERYLLVGQTATGNLYRVDLETRATRRVAITGGSLVGSDGLLLRKRVLYVVTHSGGIKEVALNARYTAGRVTATLTDPTLDFPTSIAANSERLIVTNALKPDGAADFSLTSFSA